MFMYVILLCVYLGFLESGRARMTPQRIRHRTHAPVIRDPARDARPARAARSLPLPQNLHILYHDIHNTPDILVS